jgi:hypothetical protein
MKYAGTLLIGATLLVAGCAPPASLQPASAGPQIAGDGACNADPVAWAIGQPATQEVLGKVWKQSGAGLLRPLAPGQAATRDYRPDRINVDIDAANLITGVRCG